jgi:ATPase subunit of ABC transporter with duplicated ATPase domains
MLKSKIGYNDNQSHLSEAKVLYSNEKIAFRNLSYRFEKPKRKYILQELCGNFDPGTLTAIMGPSGCGKWWVSRQLVCCCFSHRLLVSLFFFLLLFFFHSKGKSTLLDILSERRNYGKVSGSLQLVGRSKTGYVEQFDTLVAELTVEEMLWYYTFLVYPLSISFHHEHIHTLSNSKHYLYPHYPL